MSVVTQLGTFVGLLTGIAALVFLVRPELQPKVAEPQPAPARTGAQLRPLKEGFFSPDVSRRQYLALTDQAPLGFTPAQLERRGALIRFHVAIRGFEGTRLVLYAEVFDAKTGAQVSENRSLNITPPKPVIERDWQHWTPLPSRGGPFFMIIKLRAEGEPAPLATLQTPRFSRIR